MAGHFRWCLRSLMLPLIVTFADRGHGGEKYQSKRQASMRSLPQVAEIVRPSG